MKHLKAIILSVLIGVSLLLFASCDLPNAGEIDGSVTLPEQYSITYELETPEGVVTTVKKAVDAEGNVYFKSGDIEKLFIKDGKLYKLYTKDEGGNFTVLDTSASYNQTYVDNETAEFMTYAEQSKKQFIPGVKSGAEQELLGRTCLVYTIKLGGDNTNLSYFFYVDKETGICLGFESDKQIAGAELGADGQVFHCTEFLTEDIEPLSNLILE